MKKTIDKAIKELLADVAHDPARATAAAHLLAAAYPGGIDQAGGGQSPGDPPPTNPFKVGGGQSPGDPPPTSPFSRVSVVFRDDHMGIRLLGFEADGKAVGGNEIGTIEKDPETGSMRLHITR